MIEAFELEAAFLGPNWVFFQVDLSIDQLAVEQYPKLYSTIDVIRAVALTVAIFGISGNILSFITASNMGSNMSGLTFIKCLAVADSLAALQDGVIEMGLPLFGINLRAINNVACKSLAIFSWTTTIAGFCTNP